jgi:hypothetical protein
VTGVQQQPPHVEHTTSNQGFQSTTAGQLRGLGQDVVCRQGTARSATTATRQQQLQVLLQDVQPRPLSPGGTPWGAPPNPAHATKALTMPVALRRGPPQCAWVG